MDACAVAASAARASRQGRARAVRAPRLLLVSENAGRGSLLSGEAELDGVRAGCCHVEDPAGARICARVEDVPGSAVHESYPLPALARGCPVGCLQAGLRMDHLCDGCQLEADLRTAVRDVVRASAVR